MEKFKNYIDRIVKLVTQKEMSILPGHLAFNIVMMIIPIFSVIGVLGANLDLNQLLSNLENNVPNAIMEVITSAINTNTSSFNFFLFLFFSFWITSSGCRALISASDILYKVKTVNPIKKYLKSFLMVIILFLLIGFIIIVPVLGDLIINLLIQIFGRSAFLEGLYHILKYPVSLILMFMLIKTLYLISPNIKIKHKYMNNGAFFTTVSWFLLMRIYSYHLNNYSNYNLYYGSLANILIILVWVYLMAYLYTIGLALNADDYFIRVKSKEKLSNNVN